MIWALVITILISSMTGDSPLLLPESEKIVKKHVVDKEKQEKLLQLIDDAKLERKSFSKADEKRSKELNKLFQVREAKQADFDNLIAAFIASRKKMQAASLNLIFESQNLISETEWDNMKPDYHEGLNKLDKRSKKVANQVRKSFDTLEKSINTSIDDNSKKETVIKTLKDFETNLFDMVESYQKVIIDENSFVFQYQVEKQQLIDLQEEHSKNLENLLIAYTNLHFVAVENTNEDEWKKIRKKLTLPI